MANIDFSAISIAAYLLIILGLIGSVVPLLPGPIIIWFGAFVWAWGDGFVRIGWPTLTLLLLLALLAWAGDFLLTMVIGRKSGASWKAIGGAIAGGIVGGLLLSGVVPIIGSLVGAVLGALTGAFLVEYWVTRSNEAALRAMKAYLGSMALAAVIEVLLTVTMVSIFAWQAFW
jgi:uncharacterized protein YqgC (DUF456 family)